MATTTPPFTRTRPGYLISTDPTLLSFPAISAAFASSMLYWCKPLPPTTLATALSNSLNLSLYTSPSPPHSSQSPSPPQRTQIGLARLITDSVTFAWLTDVYVLDEYQGQGLGKWLVRCVDEVLAGMGDLRRAMLITGEGGPEGFYERELGMRRCGTLPGGAVIMNRNGEGVSERFLEEGDGEG